MDRVHSDPPPLENSRSQDQRLVWAFDFLFGLEEFFTPWFACTLWALVNGIANSETVIAGALGAGARELFACLAGLDELAFERPVLFPQFVFADDAHDLFVPIIVACGTLLQ
jgi:hypothetical protein